MAYRENEKALKQRSERGVAERERLRIERVRGEPIREDIDHYIKITIERRATGEVAVFECFEGNRIDNYAVICNGIHQGIQSISTLTKNIRKALPRFRRMD